MTLDDSVLTHDRAKRTNGMVVTVKVEDLQKLMDTLGKARHPSVQFSRDTEAMRERAMDATEKNLDLALGLVELMMHP